MFKKVLIAEDIDSINLAVTQTLRELGVSEIQHVKYCDDALLKIKKAKSDNEPFDLFISDLSFEADYRTVKLQSGEEAIDQIRIIEPDLAVLVYSIEDKSFRIKMLFDKYKINAYVQKGRNSIQELKKAINHLCSEDSVYINPALQHILKEKTSREIDDFDLQIIKHLSLGVTQDEMELKFKELGISPSSKSTIEKRISRLKDYFKATNTVHLIAIAKDMGIA